MNQKRLISIIAIAILAILGYFKKDDIAPPGISDAPAFKKPTTAIENSKSDANESPSSNLVMKNMQIRDVDGSVAYRGDIDLGATLARIEAGEKDSHNNDGAVFSNRERRLPIKDRGYYREYVIRTPGIRHAGPQRLVIGKQGEVYYTHDHYQTFTRIQL